MNVELVIDPELALFDFPDFPLQKKNYVMLTFRWQIPKAIMLYVLYLFLIHKKWSSKLHDLFPCELLCSMYIMRAVVIGVKHPRVDKALVLCILIKNTVIN